MTNPTLLAATALVGTTIFLSYRLAYWQQRKEGRSHMASLSSSKVFGVFLLGSAALDYVAVVANYS